MSSKDKRKINTLIQKDKKINNKGEILISGLPIDKRQEIIDNIIDYKVNNFGCKINDIAKKYNIPHTTATDILHRYQIQIVKRVYQSPEMKVMSEVTKGGMWKGLTILMDRLNRAENEKDIVTSKKIMSDNTILELIDKFFKITQTIQGEPSNITGREGMSTEQLLAAQIKIANEAKRLSDAKRQVKIINIKTND